VLIVFLCHFFIGDLFRSTCRLLSGPLEILREDELGVCTSTCKKLTVSALFNESALRHHYNVVGFLNGGELVSNADCCAVCTDVVECLLYDLFGSRIERTGRLIKKQDGRVGDDASGDCDSLLLACNFTVSTLSIVTTLIRVSPCEACYVVSQN
jgi:hypothetical protein